MTHTSLNLDAFLPYRLSRASNLVSERIAQVYESLFGLSIPEWRLVAVIAESGAITQQFICQRTHMDKVTVSRAAIALTERKLITRSPNEDDKRSHMLSLTSTGAALYNDVAPKALEMERQIFDCLTDDETAQFRELLLRLENVLLQQHLVKDDVAARQIC